VAGAARIGMLGCSIAIFSVPQGGMQWCATCPYTAQRVRMR